MKTTFKLASVLIGVVLASSASAGLVGVKTIEIKHGGNPADGWLQVAEFSTWNMSSTNVALASNGAIATAPDTWDSNSLPSKAIDGDSTNLVFPSMFHEGSPLTHDTLTITLASVEELAAFQIWGRSDCCSSRDVYDISFKDVSGALLYFADDISAANTSHTAYSALPNTNNNQVPEPGSLALIGLGLAGLGALRRKQRAS